MAMMGSVVPGSIIRDISSGHCIARRNHVSTGHRVARAAGHGHVIKGPAFADEPDAWEQQSRGQYRASHSTGVGR
eukprot:2097861-Rhodomonas_salina.2